MIQAPPDAGHPSHGRLWVEFIVLFVGAPLAMSATFGLYPLFPVLIGFAALSCLLLHLTPGWRWRKLFAGPVLGEWRLILLFASVAIAVSLIVVFALAPARLLDLPLNRTRLWLMIMLLYPIFSALPQELIFRALFFERYGALFPNRWTAIAANGAAFALGHLFFGAWVTLLMTGFGGAIMGWAYLRHRSFGLALALHALAGQIIFTVGLGIYFYHGAVQGAP
ncbi:MAG: CPBP family glutamic-type intramembrane protease [Paracoccaceae bacterium]